MIYLDHAATSFPKPQVVTKAIARAMERCANPGRGGYKPAMTAAETLFSCRETASKFFHCNPDQVVFTANCTHGLNLAIHTLAHPGARILISGFEHNAVTRPLHELKAEPVVAGTRLFDRAETLETFEAALKRGVDAAVFTHVSNAFGYILPVDELAALCRRYGVPFVVDAAQSAGSLPVDFARWGADFVAMPGHKGLQGPMGTGLLLCAYTPKPLIAGGTGSVSQQQQMPDFLPDGAEAGTLNVPGIAGLEAGIQYVSGMGMHHIARRERTLARQCAEGLRSLGMRVYAGADQGGVVSFVPAMDCHLAAERLSQRGIAVRAGLHCAPLAHRSAGTLETGTVRLSLGPHTENRHIAYFLQNARFLM